MLVVDSQTAYAAPIAQMHRQCFDEVWSESDIASLLSLPTTHLIINAYGFLIYSKILDEAEIISIGILPKFRRQGRGADLLTQMIAQESPLAKIFLEVSVQNIPARKLYAKLGFQPIGTRPGYYQTKNGPVDALRLVKTF